VSDKAARPLDVVLWGATGFTGKLVAEYLAKHYGGGKLRWAVAGRNKGKLEEVGGPAGVPVMLGDSKDRPSLDAICRQARVVVSTVGPYALYGSDLVAAAVEAGTDYCDLTGEPQFIRAMIDAHHARAQATGARIVHACGFDSIPSDLGTLMVQTRMRERTGAPAVEVRCLQEESGVALSGGTIASMMQITKEATTDGRVRRILMDPYSLDPDRGERGPDRGDQLGVRWDADLGCWTGPFALAATNTRVVRRSNALLGYSYGRDFRYSEAMGCGTGAGGWLRATGLAAGTAMFFGASAVPPVRWFLGNTVLPAAGEGPSKEAREGGHFVTRFVGVAAAADGATPVKVLGKIRGEQDPGYGETAKMLSEAAVCLALDGQAVPARGGVLTPASCMGMRLVERLRDAGMTFETNDG
jgi:short subunit dehydrogenase-like uncharacterized protein